MAHTESSDTKTTATLTIDGRQVTVATGTTILEAAKKLGIDIPTLCWLKKVSTTGACRICVVEIEGVALPLTACNTPVKDGISVTTSTPRLEEIRKKTMELMLVNHPLDCPVCDAAGECSLQDSCYDLEVTKNKYGAAPDPLPIHYDWPLIENCTTRCILCEKCTKVCHEIVGADAIVIKSCGDRSVIDTPDGTPLDCDFCGNCINACPTGTLLSKPFKFRGRPWTFDVTPSICGFCSSGCQIEYHSRNGRIERVTSSDEGYNKGNLCINGRFGYAAFNSSGRLTTPLHTDAAGNQQKSSWDQILGIAAGRLKEIIAANGSDSVAGIGSPRVTNEESYLFQKFMRGAIGTNNIDSEARLGYFPAQIIQNDMLGYSGGTQGMAAIENASAIVVIGADLKAESPGFAYRVIQAATKNDATLVLATTRVTSMNKYSNEFLQYRPGSEAFLVLGLCKAVRAEGLENTAFISQNTVGAESLVTSLDALSFEQISEVTGITEAELRQAAQLICKGGRTAVIYGAEMMRAADAINAVTAVVNLALLTGAVGSTGTGIFPLDEKNNTQGMLDMGVCPEYLPGYHTYGHAAAAFGAAWNCTVPSAPGKNLFQIIEAIEKGEIKALYVMGTDLLHVMPDYNRILKALQKLDLLIVQDLFLTETARLAHIVLPAATAAEKSGSFTSVDNRVQCFYKAVSPAGLAHTDADTLDRLHNLVAPVPTIATGDINVVHKEITTLTGLYTEVCEKSGCSISRVSSRVEFADKKAAFKAVTPATPVNTKSLTLALGTILRHNGSLTTWSENNLTVAPEAYVEIAPADAAQAGISGGDSVKLLSATGSCILKAKISSAMQPGLLFAPVHFRKIHLNQLTNSSGRTVAVTVQKA